jgi:hypothetical protein
MDRTRSSLVAVSCALLLLASQVAGAATITTDWLGAEVSITHPDSVVVGQAFDITFSVDSSTLAPFGVLAFKTYLDASDTIDIADSTWEYIFSSDDPDWNLSFTGDLGDSVTPYTHDASGYSFRLYDPVHTEWTWIWGDYNDAVSWTLHDIVLLDDTSFSLTLDERFNVPTTFDFEVAAAPVAVPATPPQALVGAALLVLAAAARVTAAVRRSGDVGGRR